MPKTQHTLFKKYTRKWLSETTGYSTGYLSRIATGRYHLTHSFIHRVCFCLKEHEEDLFCEKNNA